MIIPINHQNNELQDAKFPPQLAKLGTDEIVLFELQGSFQVEGNEAGQLAATLKVGENDEKVSMMVGHHLLEGKVIKLSKPLAVMRKRKQETSNAPREVDVAMDLDQHSGTRENTENTCEYDIVAIVKRKVLFSKRPMPMMKATTISSGTSTTK